MRSTIFSSFTFGKADSANKSGAVTFVLVYNNNIADRGNI
jgi:hypothetical protein